MAEPEEATRLNEQALYQAILRDLDSRIADVVCAALTPRFTIAMAILVVLGLLQAGVGFQWVSDKFSELSEKISTQGSTLDSTGRQVTALDGVAVRQPQLDALRDEIRQLQSANRSLSGNVSVVERQQQRIDTSVEILSGYVKSIEQSVGDERQWREAVMQEIKGLGAQLRARE